MVSNYQGFCGRVVSVLFRLGIVVSRVPSVGVMCVWLCGIGSGRIVSGFMFVEQVEHPAPRYLDICCLFFIALIAVTTGPGRSRVRMGFKSLTTVVSG